MTNSVSKIIDFTKGENSLTKRRWLRFIGLTITELIIITLIVLPFLNVVSAQSALSRSSEPNLLLGNLAGPGYQNDTPQVNTRGDDDGEDDDRDDDGGDDGDGGGDDGNDNSDNTPQPSSPNNESTEDDDNESSDTATPRVVRGPLILSNSGPPSARGVTPVFFPGNPQAGSPKSNCGFFNPNYREFRIPDLDIVGGGNYNDGFLSLDIVVTLSATDGPSFGWSIAADSVVKSLPGIFVKGGPNGNWYDYSGFTDVAQGGATFDGSLHSPVNPTNGKFYGLSHVSFCYLMPSNGGTGGGTGGTNTGTNGGNNNSSDGTSEGGPEIFSSWVPGDSTVNEATNDITPTYLPKTGVAQFWSSSVIALALIIGGLSLAVVGLHSYSLLSRSELHDQKKEDIDTNR